MWSWDFDVYRNGETSDFDGSFAYTCKLHLAAESLPERVWLGCGIYIHFAEGCGYASNELHVQAIDEKNT